MSSASAFIDSSGSKYAGRGSYSTSINSSARSAISSLTAATHATLSPMKRTFPTANAVSSWPTGRMPYRLGASSPGDDRDNSIERPGARGVNALDTCVWVRRMKNLAHQHSRKAEVVGVLAGARRLASSVHHGDWFTDN